MDRSDVLRDLEMPRQLPAADADLWLGLTPERKRVATARLLGVERFLGDEPDPGAVEGEGRVGAAARIAAALNLKVKRFYGIVRDCRDGPSLRGLGVYAGSAAERTNSAGGRRIARIAAMLEVLAEKPDATTPELIRATAAIDEESTLPSLARWAEEARRLARRPGRFGETLLLSFEAVDAVDVQGRRLFVFVVLDEGTAVPLGWQVTNERNTAGYYHACRHAADRLARMPLPPMETASEQPRVKMRHDVGPATDLMRLMGHLETSGFRFEAGSEPSWLRRPLRKIIGPRIGPFRIRPEETATGKRQKGDRLIEIGDAMRLVSDALEARVTDVLARYQAGDEPKAVADARGRMMELLRIIALPVDRWVPL